MKWLDLNRDGRVNTADLLIGIVYLCAAILGLTLMFSTWARSFHLLSSPQMNPGVFSLWPWITSLSPEAGFFLADFCMHAGIRKQYLTGIALGVIGMVLFGLVIGTMQWYDVELVRGASLAEVGKWADYVATFVALITIGYAAVVTGVIEYINIDSRSAGGSTYTSARPIVKATVPRMSLPEGDEQLEELKFIAPQSTSKGNGAGEDHPQQANFQRPPVRR